VALKAAMATITAILPCCGSSNNVVAIEAVMATNTAIPPHCGSSKALVEMDAVMANKTTIPPYRGSSNAVVEMEADVACPPRDSTVLAMEVATKNVNMTATALKAVLLWLMLLFY
jgi:hypothetical protein